MPTTSSPSQLLSTPYDLSAASIERFRRDGFIKLKKVLDGPTLAHYGEAVTALTLALNPLANVPMEERNTYDKAFIQVGNLWEQDDTVREFTFSKRLARIAAELLEVSGVRLWHDQALYKEPAGGFTPWHVDQQYWPMLTDRSVTAWIPLQAVPPEMGPLEFGLRSHTMNIARQVEISDESEAIIQGAVDRYHIPKLFEPFDLGEVSFHLGWTLHRAGGNSTGKPRAVHTIIYMEQDQRLAEPQNKFQQADWEAWTPSTKIGDVMADAKNPVLYSGEKT
ncbi:MAG: phytanoyl-CoA dioxygenase family protein [Aeoliella sp.]